MMIRCLSQLRTRSGAARFRSFGLNCASSQPKNLRSLSKRLPFAGYALLGVHRYFSKLNGKSNEVIDRSKFTHEVKICMPDLGEGEDVKVLRTYIETSPNPCQTCLMILQMFTFGLCTDDEFDSIMGDILVPENSKPVAAGTVICTTFNEAHDDDKGNELDGDNSDKVGSKKADN
ncbi:hypothetical protein ACHAWX_001905 [Stephanocyclus meneghinianus]